MKRLALISFMVAGSMFCLQLSATAQQKKAVVKKSAVAPSGKQASGAASNSKFKKLNGVEYLILRDAPGNPVKVGDVIELHAVLKLGKNNGRSKDSILVDTRKSNNGLPITMPLAEPKFRGDMVAGLVVLSPGDSAIVRVPFDTLKAGIPNQAMPPFAKSGDYFVYEISLVSAKSKEEAEKEAKAKSQKQAATDDKAIQNYLTENKINAQRTASGLYYVITKEGKGDKVAAGKTASVWYTGKSLDGKTFDSNVDSAFHHTDVFTVKVGAGQVIPGWDEGIQLLKKGTKATFYLPSVIAYGDHAVGAMIPANSILMFDIEVTDVQ